MAPPPVPVVAPVVQAAAAVNPAVITDVLEQWRAAWAGKNADAYLSFYAPDFRPQGMPRPKWEAQRRDRLAKPSFISIKLVDPQVTLIGDKTAVAVFVQQYESDVFKEAGKKTVVFAD